MKKSCYPMPKCPRCGKEIDSITNVQSGYMEYVLKIDENGDYDYDSSDGGFSTDDMLNDSAALNATTLCFRTARMMQLLFSGEKLKQDTMRKKIV